ncbi:hypothetical protein NM208_g14075 [Fusarium decemcellulare]|uniref:Uncharacterized protein n=1 Tax=Fusarium decemcellulare TaxID=57161 RepID=A0ACC1RHH8_9HYPO|nr:hypothetical protein NM208_g14075 [Fusarium decemcellulare]
MSLTLFLASPAENKGMHLTCRLVEEHELEKIQTCMYVIQDATEQSYRRIGRDRPAPRSRLLTTWTMDLASLWWFPSLQTTLPPLTLRALGWRCSYGSYAPSDVSRSDIPLNQGCVSPPSEMANVVGGKVLASQRITDVILKAFGASTNS